MLGAGLTALEQRTRDVEIAVRRVRWFAIPFTVVQFALFSPSDGASLPFPRWPVAALYVLALLATNVLSLWATRNASPDTLRRIGLLELFVDTTLANGIVILFGFDADSRMWPLLSFPIVEGAMRAQLRGAMVVWAYGAGVYAIDQLVRLPGREDPEAWIGSIPWGVGILLFIGLGTGLLALRVREATIAEETTIAELRELDRMKDDFFSILTHELRSPLSSVSGAAEMLAVHFDDLAPDRRARLLDLIHRGSRRLNRLVEDAHDAMRAEQLELPIKTIATPLGRLVREIAADEVGRSPDHELVLDVDNAPPALVDPQRMHQVIQNLLSNAVKYSPSGGRVTVRLCRDDGHVLLEVEDDGVGIDEQAQRLLFGRFQRLHADASIPGTGLGLYLVRSLVEAMGGTVAVESTLGRGSTFQVRLPAADAVTSEGASR